MLHIIGTYIQGHSEGTSSVSFELLIINCHIEIINLFIFNCLMSNINLFFFNCFTSNFCFEKRIFYKQNRMTVYGRASLVPDFKLTRENNNLLSSRYKLIFEISHPVYEHMKVGIPNRRYQTNTVRTF